MRTSALLLGSVTAAVAACHVSASPPASNGSLITPSNLEAMQNHAAHGAAMRDGVARGDLRLARREAALLSTLRMNGAGDLSFREHLGAMRGTAALVADAGDVPAASRALARAARACGNCHAAIIEPRVHVGSPPEDRSEVVPAMQRHQWAAVRLWYGLVFPSSSAWSAGATALAGAPLDAGRLTPMQTPVPQLVTLNLSVRRLADQAVAAVSADERERVYGELMSTCSACHAWLGGGPPGAPAPLH